MALAGAHIVMHLGPGGLTAVVAHGEREGVRVLCCLRAARPEAAGGADAGDASAEGRWVRGVLAEAGVRAKRAVIALDRHEVVIKRFAFDLAGDVAGDLPGMVRLRMIRQLPFAADDAAIDYVPLPDERRGGDEGGGVSVLAAALPGERLAWFRAMARAAHLRIERVALRGSGVATLLAEASAGAVMGIAPGADGAEFVVVEGGHLVFARRAEECALPGDEAEPGGVAGVDVWDEVARRIAVEARRTWMSYVVAPGARSVESAWVLGAGGLMERVAERCGESLELPCDAAGSFGRVRFEEAASGCGDAASLALAGLALQKQTSQAVLDLAHPRRPPDRNARVRQMAMAGVFVMLLAIGLWFTWLNGVKGDLAREAELLKQQAGDVSADAVAAQREKAQLDFLERWVGADVPWLAHLGAVGELLPGRDEALLERMTAVATPRVEYERGRSRSYDSRKWVASTPIRIGIDGRAKDQGAVERLRGAFVGDERYVATPSEPDGGTTKDDAYPRSFALVLRTLLRDPTSADGDGADGDEGDGGGGA